MSEYVVKNRAGSVVDRSFDRKWKAENSADELNEFRSAEAPHKVEEV